MERDGTVLYLAEGTAFPAYLAGADESVTNNWVAWAGKYGANTNAAHEGHFLLDVSPATAVPEGASMLKVVDFSVSSTNFHLEVASDVAPLTQPEGEYDSPEVCNGYLAVVLAADLGAFSSNPVNSSEILTLPVPANVNSAGHAVIDIDVEELLMTLFPYVPPSYISFPDRLFFRPVLTPIYPDYDPTLWE